MKTIYFFFVLIISIQTVFSQNVEDLILPNGKKYIYQEVEVSFNQLEEVLATNAEAFYYFKNLEESQYLQKFWVILRWDCLPVG